jgi:hypothetical protein
MEGFRGMEWRDEWREESIIGERKGKPKME